ncbi:MAG TPA: hypothetical protein VFR41_06810, partial [Acidimicrobiia bacterium]|nr:hypothetical protein [Acidimicrobiia bacterium]
RGDARLHAIELTDALDYRDGNFLGGPEAEALIDSYGRDAPDRDGWLRDFADAVRRFWDAQR